MGVYAVTGGSSGIGAKTVELLRKEGHRVVNIDQNGGEITADITTPEGRLFVIGMLHEKFPEGLDGMLCNAGVSAACGNLKRIISLNYFGAVVIAEGVFDLLELKKGYCVVTASNTISQGAIRMDVVNLLNNQMDETRVLKLVENDDPAANAHLIYVATKYALARWMRRVSAHWASRGVHINAVAPGNVATAMTAALPARSMAACMAIPIPTLYHQNKLMDPEDIARAIVFLSSPMASGINGVILFCDGGTDALLNTEKVY